MKSPTKCTEELNVNLESSERVTTVKRVQLQLLPRTCMIGIASICSTGSTSAAADSRECAARETWVNEFACFWRCLHCSWYMYYRSNLTPWSAHIYHHTILQLYCWLLLSQFLTSWPVLHKWHNVSEFSQSMRKVWNRRWCAGNYCFVPATSLVYRAADCEELTNQQIKVVLQNVHIYKHEIS